MAQLLEVENFSLEEIQAQLAKESSTYKLMEFSLLYFSGDGSTTQLINITSYWKQQGQMISANIALS